ARRNGPGAPVTSALASSSAEAKGPAEPSRIGASGPLISISASTIASPESALRRCSNVITVPPGVARFVLRAGRFPGGGARWAMVAGIVPAPARFRRIPLPRSPGSIRTVASFPVKRPGPLSSTGRVSDRAERSVTLGLSVEQAALAQGLLHPAHLLNVV